MLTYLSRLFQVVVSSVLLFAIVPETGYSQTYNYVYRNKADSSYNCYLLVVPENDSIRGVIIRDYSSLPRSAKSPYQWFDLAMDNGFAVLYTVTSNYFPELYYNDSGPELLDEMVHEAITIYDLPADQLFIGGISASGTRALRYTIYCEQGKSKYKHKIKGTFSVDSPLDLERFYYSAKRHEKRFRKGMLWEAQLMNKVFPEKLGTPRRNKACYTKYSVFSYKRPKKSSANYLINVPLFLVHEPDMDWWGPERGAKFYDINSYDITGMTRYLRSKGHDQITLIETTGKGFDRKGERNCHSWTIVNEEKLINWIVRLSEGG